MGKKKDNKKKGKGAEKTAAKTEKKLGAKQKKELAAIGEDDIEKIVAQIEKEEKRRLQVVETDIEFPSRRVNFSFVAHPDKDELILFGGEFFDGQKTFLFNDLLFYNIPQNKWTLLKAPSGPPPRCSHQMVTTSANKGQLWLFGGEYASPTQSQFYHYKDLWAYHMVKKQWEKVEAPGGPSPRSGHRMILVKKQLMVFGGFHDNLRDFKYFNDVHGFNLETRTWCKFETTGIAPAPRSGCNMFALPDGRILIYGGYSKERIKKDVDKGHVYSDSFLLTPDKNDTTGTKWKWTSTKLGGVHFSARCSMPTTVAPNNVAYCFGGVFDMEDDEEDISGHFFNDLHSLDLNKLMWRDVIVSGKKESKASSQRRRVKENEPEDDGTADDQEMEEPVEKEPAIKTVADDGIFKVTVGPALTQNAATMDTGDESSQLRVFQPSARSNCGLAVKRGNLYLFGGLFEDGSKQLTLNDFNCLDLHKLDEWKVIHSDDLSTQEWFGSDSEDSDNDNEDGSGESDSSDESDDEDSEKGDDDQSPMETE